MGLNAANKAAEKFLNNAICVSCGSDDIFVSEGSISCKECGKEVSSIHEKEKRMEWKYNKEEIFKIEYEIKKYNKWAEKEMKDIRYENKVSKKWYDYEIYEGNPPIKRDPSILGKMQDVEGWDVLDVGGSCVDSWRFLPAGAASINQVEPAPESQRLGVKRLRTALSGSGIKWRDKILFHTVVAEKLPFQKNTFDMVFSRSSIHHTSRPESLRECFRVLKPGGYILFIEPRYDHIMDLLRSIYRRMRRVNRGSDRPLVDEDILKMKNLSSKFSEKRYGLIDPLKIFLGVERNEEKMNRVTSGDIFGLRFCLEKALLVARK